MTPFAVTTGRGLIQGRQLRAPKAVEEDTEVTMGNPAVEVIGPEAVVEVPTNENTFSNSSSDSSSRCRYNNTGKNLNIKIVTLLK